jgi:hypothetical protein
MNTNISSETHLQRGDFVRVKATGDFRPRADGMVIRPQYDGTKVGLLFMYDRYNQPQSISVLWS